MFSPHGRFHDLATALITATIKVMPCLIMLVTVRTLVDFIVLSHRKPKYCNPIQ